MDFEELLRKLQEQVAFWQKDNPTTPLVNQAKGTIRDVGRVADDYLMGGMGQSALRGPDALSRQIALNALLAFATRGAVEGASNVFPKVAKKILPIGEKISDYNFSKNYIKENRQPFEEYLFDTGVFDQGFGGVDAMYSRTNPDDVWAAGNLTKKQVKKIDKRRVKDIDEFVNTQLQEVLSKELSQRQESRQGIKELEKFLKNSNKR
jgi:hypothetical protein